MFEEINIFYLIIATILFFVDFITGATRGKREKELSSKDGKKGFIFFILTMLGFVIFEGIGISIDLAIFHSTGYKSPITAQFIFGTLLFLYYCWIQGLSIAENFVDLGYPVPTSIKKYLKTNSNEDRADDLAKAINVLTENKDKLEEIKEILKK